MRLAEVFRFLCDDIHTVVLATVGGDGNAVTCAIDVMDCDEGGLYFLTARGKSLFTRLKARPNVALTGIRGDSTLTRVAVSVCGRAEEQGDEVLARLMDKNRYMYEIYPDAAARRALVAFKISSGTGEYFDLSKHPIERFSFSFGGQSAEEYGYFIAESCTVCKKCAAVCPQGCISFEGGRARIIQRHCLRCGNCMNVCPCGAVVLNEGSVGKVS